MNTPTVLDRAQTFNYAVSLEFDVDPALTSRGRICASATTTVVVAAVRKALRDYPRRQWRSLVVVLERARRRT